MGKAFSCDLCEGLQHGEPLGSLTFEITDPDQVGYRVERVLCRVCLNSYEDWCIERMPPEPPEHAIDDDDEDTATGPYA